MKKISANNYIFSKTLIAGFGLIAYFLVTAILSSMIGHYVDVRFEIEPMGTVGSMVVGYIFSIIIAIAFIARGGFHTSHNQ